MIECFFHAYLFFFTYLVCGKQLRKVGMMVDRGVAHRRVVLDVGRRFVLALEWMNIFFG